MFSSLKFHIAAALILMVVLFASALSYTLLTLEHQRSFDSLITLSSRLQLTVQQLSNQAMRYKRQAPRDMKSYARDLDLYYQDLLNHVEVFDMITKAFMRGDFTPEVTGLSEVLHPTLGNKVKNAISGLEDEWMSYRRELFDKLGRDLEEPRLEWGAEYILENNIRLEESTDQLSDSLQHWTTRELEHIRALTLGVLGAAGIIAIAVMVWLFARVILPLNATLKGFRQVTEGDFGHQVPERGSVEIVQLTRAFNHLSSRISLVFELIDRLQQGSDLDQTLYALSREFQTLMPIDWIGVLFATDDKNAVKLEAAYLDGEREYSAHPLYRLENTLLEKAMAGTAPLRFDQLPQLAAENPHYVFLGTLAERGMQDSIFLPIPPESQSPAPGVLVFASRRADSYDQEHLRLMNNIAQLVTHTFGRTVKLAERGRLAAIGEFASGIAHEIRNPLATINLALEHLDKQELPPSSHKRAGLALGESQRLGRLLEDMLLYARPLSIQTEPLNLSELLTQLHKLHREQADDKTYRLRTELGEEQVWIMGDQDRLSQIWLNLTRNAEEASPEDTEITWSVKDEPSLGVVSLQIRNFGEPIPSENLQRLTEAFYTTKSSGTGLGLAIVKRLTEAHGGDMRISSDRAQGTRVTLSLPRHASS